MFLQISRLLRAVQNTGIFGAENAVNTMNFGTRAAQNTASTSVFANKKAENAVNTMNFGT